MADPIEVARRPRHLILGIVETGMLPGDPAVRHAVRIQRQYQRHGLARASGIVDSIDNNLVHVSDFNHLISFRIKLNK